MTHHLSDLETKIGYRFADPDLLRLALTHKSCESPEGDNERLEFLGDAVLDLAIAETLYRKYTDQAEGTLDHMRAYLVNGEALAGHARSLGIEAYLQVSEAQRQHHPEPSAGMLENALEALVGAVYLDGGIAAAHTFVLNIFETAILGASEACNSDNPKGRLQEWLQKEHAGATPEYSILSEEGPPHACIFTARVAFDNRELGRGKGNSKKAAETKAAKQALAALKD